MIPIISKLSMGAAALALSFIGCGAASATMTDGDRHAVSYNAVSYAPDKRGGGKYRAVHKRGDSGRHVRKYTNRRGDGRHAGRHHKRHKFDHDRRHEFKGHHFRNKKHHRNRYYGRHYRYRPYYGGYFYGPSLSFHFGHGYDGFSGYYSNHHHGHHGGFYGHYGYSSGCYDCGSGGLVGALTGGIIGGLIGAEIDGGYDKSAGTAIGAGVGALLGYEVGRESDKSARSHGYSSDFHGRATYGANLKDSEKEELCLVYRFDGERYHCTKRAEQD